jgi:predicted membrane-bound mannosyltransferase/sugar lactone lactonase YvrE
METIPESQSLQSWLDRPVLQYLPKFNVETLLAVIIIILTVFSRLYILGDRVMSHDETNHVVPSYSLFTGNGYVHDPVTHGPMQFHLVALSYFILGDSDFSSRIPSALFSIATVCLVLFGFRRYLGRAGALIAGFLFMISPYMLFYGRYTRNESFVALFGVLTIWAVLRYLENGKVSSLYVLAAVISLQFCTKETAYIYMAQLLLFLAVIFIKDVLQRRWATERNKSLFTILISMGVILILVAVGLSAVSAKNTPATPVAGAPAIANTAVTNGGSSLNQLAVGLVGAGVLFAAVGLFLLVRGVTWQGLKTIRSFDLLILTGTLVLPQLTAFPVKMLGGNPLDYTNAASFSKTAVFLIGLLLVSILIGVLWNPRRWLTSAAIFYVIYILLYTTFFTNGHGFFTGIVGSLGYWLEQQGVNRGSQPWYFYALIQIPIYEYLAALGSILAFYFGLRYWRFSQYAGYAPARQPSLENSNDPSGEPSASRPVQLPVLAMLLFLSVTSLIAYSVAGEKMPWLTVHIALPMLLAAGWGLGFVVDTTLWKTLKEKKHIFATLLIPFFLWSVFSVFGSLLGATPPFQGRTLDQLNATTEFILALVVSGITGYAIFIWLKDLVTSQALRLLTLGFFAILAVLTARTAYTASFINYDTAKEFLVYAHAARGPKDALTQLEEISRLTTGGKDIMVAYDNDTRYPYWWYLRDYPKRFDYDNRPTRELTKYAVIFVGQDNFSKVEPIVKDGYVKFELPRLWWPMQDYFNLDSKRIGDALKNPKMRAALIDIWLNRDYTQYAEVTGSTTLTLTTWQPSSLMRMYIRKDVIAQIWKFGVAPTLPAASTQTDPYAANLIKLAPDMVVGVAGPNPGQFNAPRGVAVASDGSFYVADAGNNRIQHFSKDGQILQVWGAFADATKADANAPGGTFNEPWGVAVAPDGSVYVTDTWNHRVQKFTADGKFITMWGYFGQGEKPEAFYGPRGIAVDSKGNVYVTDTGNKRVVIFDGNGKFIAQFGSAGVDNGQFDEPVGVAVDSEGKVYVNDTWNQRVQVFAPDPTGMVYTYLLSWQVSGWTSQSLDNKPFLAVDAQNNVFLTDPEGYRVLEFNQSGAFLQGWGDYSSGSDGLGLPVGIASDQQGHIWVADSANNLLLRFQPPAK